MEIPTTIASIIGLTFVEFPRPIAIGRKSPALAVLLAMMLMPKPKATTKLIITISDCPLV